MKVNKELVDKIAHLARLEFHDEEKEKMTNDLTNILDWVDKLKEIDTENVEPLTHVSEEVNTFRKNDDTGKHMSHEEALKNAPKKDSDYFRVPKFVETEAPKEN